MKILIVEDDSVMQKTIQEVVLHHFPEFELLTPAETVSEARQAILDNTPDLVLLDIILSDGTAFDLLRQIEIIDFKLVFISGHDDYLREAIRFSSVSSVLKPFDVSDLVVAIDKACEAVNESDYQQKMEILLSNTDSPASDRVVVFPTVDVNYSAALSSILYGEAVPGGCIIHLDSGKEIYVPRPLRRYEQLFGNYAFLRCHPLYLVNLRKVTRIDESNFNLILFNKVKVPLEQRRYKTVQQKLLETGLFKDSFSTRH